MINKDSTEIRKIMPIIYAIDTSVAMKGERIACVNEIMIASIEMLREIASENPTVSIQIGVVTYDRQANWITCGLEDLEDCLWSGLSANEKAGWFSSWGETIKILDKEMHLGGDGFLPDKCAFYKPTILFIAGGQPSDNWRILLNKANETNKIFRMSTKLALAVGDDVDVAALEAITGQKEAILRVDPLNTSDGLMDVICKITRAMTEFRAPAYGRDLQLPNISHLLSQAKENQKYIAGNAEIKETTTWDDDDWD